MAGGGMVDPVVEAGHYFGYGGSAIAYIVYVHSVGDASTRIRLSNQTLF